VQPIMEEPDESRHTYGYGGGGNDKQLYSQRNESENSDIGTLPSPTAYQQGGPYSNDEEHRRSIFDTISPVSPTMGRR